MMTHGSRILSSVDNSCHCICALDYDDVDYDTIRKEIKEIQKKFDLETFYIFRTKSRHYSALCFSIVTETEMKQLLRRSSIDKKQEFAFSNLKAIGFRISKKFNRFLPAPFAIVKRKSKRHASLSHAWFFAGLYPSFVNPKVRGDFSDLVIEEFKLREAKQ